VPPGATGWIVPEADVFTRPSWFWTPGSDGALFSLERLRDVWDRSVGHGANLLINMTPDRRGLVPEAEVRRLAELGDDVRRRFGHPIAETAGEGRWSEGQVLELAWERTATVASAVMEEDLRFGQRVSRHRVEAEVGGAWRTVAEGTTIGRRRIVSFAPVAARRLRLRILETASLPEIRLFAAYG
jgi:alpha-L-fucosidase